MKRLLLALCLVLFAGDARADWVRHSGDWYWRSNAKWYWADATGVYYVWTGAYWELYVPYSPQIDFRYYDYRVRRWERHRHHRHDGRKTDVKKTTDGAKSG